MALTIEKYTHKNNCQDKDRITGLACNVKLEKWKFALLPCQKGTHIHTNLEPTVSLVCPLVYLSVACILQSGPVRLFVPYKRRKRNESDSLPPTPTMKRKPKLKDGKSCLVLSCLVLTRLVLSCLDAKEMRVTVYHQHQQWRGNQNSKMVSLVLSCLVLSWLVLSCLVLTQKKWEWQFTTNTNNEEETKTQRW